MCLAFGKQKYQNMYSNETIELKITAILKIVNTKNR